MLVTPGTLTAPARISRGKPVPVHDPAPAPGYRLTTTALQAVRRALRPSDLRLTAAAIAVVQKRM